MSSCQDSMDTEDSIPRPEYEQIVPHEVDEEECDQEFWIKNQKQMNSTQPLPHQTERSIINSRSPRTDDLAFPATSSNNNQLYRNKHVDETMEESGEDDEISYDEASEPYDEDEYNEESKKLSDDVDNSQPIEPPLPSRDPLKLSEQSNATVIDSPASSSPPPIETKDTNKNVMAADSIKENSKQTVPATPPLPFKPAPSALPEENHNQITNVSREIRDCQNDEERLAIPKEEQHSRSNTPLNRANREYIALQKAFINSKFLSDFVNEPDRPRKSRKVALKSEDSMDDKDDKEKFRIGRARSKSCTRTALARPTSAVLNMSAPQKWPSDEKLNSKRENMRSQNTDFVQKQMKFLNRVNQEHAGDDPLSDQSDGEQSSLNDSQKVIVTTDSKDDWQPPPKRGSDSFCWKCKKCADLIPCSKCPRSFHSKCVKVCATTRLDKTWICSECLTLDSCINGPKKVKKEALSMDMVNQLLQYALKRMKQVKGHEQLLDVPDESEYPLYSQYVVNPVTLNSIQEKIEKKAFRCTEEFVLEAKWIQHNVSIAYAAHNNKITSIAKLLLKVCRQEAAEIETCSECYLNANTRVDWFVDVCPKPHILLWAKLKGFPYWPAKGMGLGPNSLVNVRFFGDHDRAFVPVKDCFLYSEIDPNPHSGKRAFRPGIADCIKEVDIHIENIKAKVGAFNYAPGKTPYDSNNEMTQLEEMMPGVAEYIKRQQALQKPPLTYKIVKTAGNNLSMIKKPDSGTDSDHSSLGAERHRRKSRSSTEITKTSPLSDVKKTKDSPNTSQNCTPKPTPTNKVVPNKPMSSNYEVVAKPLNKDESNSSKINSVILKRKSDIVLVSSNLKKSRSAEDVPSNDTNHIASPSSKSDDNKDNAKDSAVELPAKRPRISRSREKTPIPAPAPAQIPNAIVPAYRVDSSDIPKNHTSQQETKTPTPPKLQPQVQPQKTKATTNPFNNDPSSAMAKLVQNRQGVTIRKIYKEQAGTTIYSPIEDHTSKAVIEKRIATKAPLAQSKPLPQPDPIPSTSKPITSPPKSVSASSSPKVQVPSKQSSPMSEKTPPPTGLIPFEDIKVERTDDDQSSSIAFPSSSNKLADPLASSSNTSTPTPLSSASTPNGNAKSISSTVNTPPLPVDPDLVKKETISDDESSSTSTLSRENHSPAITTSQPNASKPLTDTPRLVGETMIQRIVVRSLESLTMQPPAPLKNSTSNITNTAVTPTTLPTVSNMTSIQPKKSNARARKSFPNKAPNSSNVMPPRSLTKNSMVYIPVDSQNNSVPMRPLTAVSKSTNLVPILPKVTCAATIPIPVSTNQPINSSPATNSISVSSTTPVQQVTTQTTLPTVATIVTSMNSSINSSTATTVTNSVTTRPSYVSSLKTLSPLQLTPPTSSSNEIEENNESGQAEGHILSGIVTPSLAAAITDTIVRGPPRLAPRPNGALRSDGNYGFNSNAGPVSRVLVEGAHKMTDFFISVMKDTVHDMASTDVLQAKIVELQLELESKIASYEKRLFELKQNTDTMLCEMKKSMESERLRIIAETRKQCEIERIHAVEQTKKRQWCVNCGREANSYCCWNTAYCDTNCQSMDWVRHKPHCCQVNPHLNSEVQGPGRLYSAPTTVTACTTITTPSNQTISGTALSNFLPLQPVQMYRTCYPPVSSPSSTSTLLPTSTSNLTATGAAQKKGTSPTNASSIAISASTSDLTFKSKEVLKLPPRTYLRPVSTAVQRFKLPLPIASNPPARGPPYTLIHREGGNWELMGGNHPPPAAAPAFQQQPSRMVTTVTANLTQDSRLLGQVIVRPTQM